MTCQRVAPMASAASRSARATAPSALRVKATMVGKTITANTTDAKRMLGP